MDLTQWLESLLSFGSGIAIARAILAVVLVFFLPGFAWTLVFFSGLGVLERIALSMGLSIALVTLSVIVTNFVFGVRITGTNSIIIILLVTVAGLGGYALKRFVFRKKSLSNGD